MLVKAAGDELLPYFGTNSTVNVGRVVVAADLIAHSRAFSAAYGSMLGTATDDPVQRTL